jgi:hypothetical protein
LLKGTGQVEITYTMLTSRQNVVSDPFFDTLTEIFRELPGAVNFDTASITHHGDLQPTGPREFWFKSQDIYRIAVCIASSQLQSDINTRWQEHVSAFSHGELIR